MINEKIALVRIARKLTQAQLAQKLGISVTSYAKLERGESELTVHRLSQICKILRCKEWIFFVEQEPIAVLSDFQKEPI